MTRLPRTIQLDPSDNSVFDHAAEPGEWAVPGSFEFLEDSPDPAATKRAQAFRHGFLGTSSFGWSTLVMVADASPAIIHEITEALARHFVGNHGAPDLETARTAAREEVAFAASICDHKVGTLLTIYRQHGPDGLVEQFATVTRDDPSPDLANDTGPNFGEPFDLLALATRTPLASS